jgi:DNA-3-methyladenine glycosylase II
MGASDAPGTDGGAPSSEAENAYLVLAGADDVLARIVGVYGHPDPFEWSDGGRTGSSLFAAMVLHVTSQRISAAAAFSVFDRMTAAGGSTPAPDTLLALGAGRLRALGLSGGKVRCLLELARRQATGLIDLENMGALSDDDVIGALTAVPGIGLWSAQAFLLRQLRRADVLPAGDTGIRRAIGREWHLAAPPAASQVRDRAAAWVPFRSYAAALLWRSLHPPGEPSDPKARALAKAGKRTRRP